MSVHFRAVFAVYARTRASVTLPVSLSSARVSCRVSNKSGRLHATQRNGREGGVLAGPELLPNHAVTLATTHYKKAEVSHLAPPHTLDALKLQSWVRELEGSLVLCGGKRPTEVALGTHQARMSGGTSCGRNIAFGNITEANVNQLRRMNASIFPVRYHDKFYADVTNGNPDFNQFGESFMQMVLFCRRSRPRLWWGDHLYLVRQSHLLRSCVLPHT